MSRTIRANADLANAPRVLARTAAVRRIRLAPRADTSADDLARELAAREARATILRSAH